MEHKLIVDFILTRRKTTRTNSDENNFYLGLRVKRIFKLKLKVDKAWSGTGTDRESGECLRVNLTANLVVDNGINYRTYSSVLNTINQSITL